MFGKQLKSETSLFKAFENKKFFGDVEEKVYEKVVNATALKSDFDILPAGDETEIGEKVSKLTYIKTTFD